MQATCDKLYGWMRKLLASKYHNPSPFSERERVSRRVSGVGGGEWVGVSRGPGQSVAWGQSPGIEIQGRRDRLDPLGPTLVAILLRVGGPGL